MSYVFVVSKNCLSLIILTKTIWIQWAVIRAVNEVLKHVQLGEAEIIAMADKVEMSEGDWHEELDVATTSATEEKDDTMDYGDASVSKILSLPTCEPVIH